MLCFSCFFLKSSVSTLAILHWLNLGTGGGFSFDFLFWFFVFTSTNLLEGTWTHLDTKFFGNQRFSLKIHGSCWMVEKSFETGWDLRSFQASQGAEFLFGFSKLQHQGGFHDPKPSYWNLPPWKLTVWPWKMMVGRCISYWNSLFLGDMFVFRGVRFDVIWERSH